jgi:hypothetical protein
MSDLDDLGPLPKAERSNELERESIADLQKRLPADRLLFRRENSDDFGVDGTLELIVNGAATNFRANAQLKATEHPQFNLDGSLSLSIEVSNLNYLLNGASPIYLLYVAPSGEMFYAWGRDEKKRIETSNPSWREQKTVVIRFARRVNASAVDDICERIREEASILRSWDCNLGKVERILPSPKSLEEQAQAKELESERIRQVEEYRTYSKRVYEEKKKAKRKLKRHWADMFGQALTNRELEGFANKLQFFDVHEIMEAISIAASKQLDSYVAYVHGILNRWRDDPASRPQLSPRHDTQTPSSRAIGRRPANATPRIGPTSARNEVPANLSPPQRILTEEVAGERNAFLAIALFEDHEPSDLNKRYTLVRWHMLDSEDWTLDDTGSEECSFPHFHMAAACIPPDSIPLESKNFDAKMHPRGQAPLRNMPGYVTSWMVNEDDLRSHDPQAVMDGWLRGTKGGDIQKYRDPRGMYMLSLWVDQPTNNDHDLRGYLVSRGKVPAKGEEPKLESRGTWFLHEAMSWLPPPTLMMAEWQMEMYATEKKGRFRRTANEDGPIAVWYAPAEVVEGPARCEG